MAEESDRDGDGDDDDDVLAADGNFGEFSSTHPPNADHVGRLPPVSLSDPASPTSQSRLDLTANAVKQQEQTTEAQAASTDKLTPIWPPLLRYYSNQAYSFPDYGPPRSAMGADRLRRMNQATGPVNTLTSTRRMNQPVNTLTSTVVKRSFPDLPSALNHSLHKRQRLDKLCSSSKSPSHISDARLELLDPIQHGSPPPANITSDIAPTSRRPKRHSVHTSSPSKDLHAKRPKDQLPHDEIDSSEDELSINHTTFVPQTRQTNFSRIIPSPRASRPMRGNIASTIFDPKPTERHVASPPMAVSKAVSGKYTYDAEHGNHPPLTLYPSTKTPSILEAWSENRPDEAYAWLTFDTKNLQTIKYGGKIFSFRRPSIQDRAPLVSLQLATVEGALNLARLIGHQRLKEQLRETMEQTMANLWKKAINSQPAGRYTSCLEKSTESKVSISNTIQETLEPVNSKSGKLKDRMTLRSPIEEKPTPSLPPVRRRGMETRRTCLTSSPRSEASSPVLEKWSLKNKGWQEEWTQTLVYPATGRNRTSVDKEDILRLDEGEFLNDNLISFYLRYLQTNMETEKPDLVNRVHIFSTFFFEKLTSRKDGINYEGVRSWTSKLDLFSYDYIAVPVNENAHWYLAVICNVPQLLHQENNSNETSKSATHASDHSRPATPTGTAIEREMSDVSIDDAAVVRRSSRQLFAAQSSSPANPFQTAAAPATPAQGSRAPSRRLDSSQPHIVTLDSLGSNHAATCKALKDYLVEEAKHKKNIVLNKGPAGMKAHRIPEQTNFCDCGVFVLAYMEEFLKDPDGLMGKILMKEKFDWSINTIQLRQKVRDILFKLQKEQNERLAKEKRERRQRKRLGKSSIASVTEVSTEPLKDSKTSVNQNSTSAWPQQSQTKGACAVAKSGMTPSVPEKSASTNDTVQAHVNDNTVGIAKIVLNEPSSVKDKEEAPTDDDAVVLVKTEPEKSASANDKEEASTDDDAVIMVKTEPEKLASTSNTEEGSSDDDTVSMPKIAPQRGVGEEITVNSPFFSQLRSSPKMTRGHDSVRLVSVVTKSQPMQQSRLKSI